MRSPRPNAGTEALIQAYLEGTLTPDESLRLLAALKSQPELVCALLDGLRMDALIREVVLQRATVKDFAVETSPHVICLPKVVPAQDSRRAEVVRESFSRLKYCSLPRRLHLPWNRPAVLALAASIVVLLGLSVWYFGATLGQPMLAEVKGADVAIERGTEFIPVANGMRLESADVLHVGANASAKLVFGPEKTRFELSAGTELKLASLAQGKRFVLSSGRIEATVARQRPFQPMVFTTPQAEARVLGTEFSLLTEGNATRLEVAEGKVKLTRTSDGRSTNVLAGNYAVAAAGYELAAQPLTGRILREYWTNLPGDYYITYLTSHRDFPEHPSGREYLDKFEAPSHWGTNYGARLCGFLHPPKSGDYTFWIAAGGGAAFFLSHDDHPENKQQLACASGVSPHQWTKDPGQESSALTLVAGRKYFIEVLQKQGAKPEDHLAVAWQGPGRPREVIPGECLSPLNPKSKGRE